MTGKRIMVSPLNWGLGHATRLVPVIHILLEMGHEVILAGNGASLKLLEAEFPNCRSVSMPDFDMRYASGRWMAIHIFLQVPKLLKSMVREARFAERMVKKEDVDLVISDNRLGFRSKEVPSVVMSHQLSIEVPVFKKRVNKVNTLLMNCFNQVWAVDLAPPNSLSGPLAENHNLKVPIHYMGILSRFEPDAHERENQPYCAGIISGPEPQRSWFEKVLINQMKELSMPCVLVRGKPDGLSLEPIKGITIYNHLPAKKLEEIIKKAQYVVCRSGYSSIMDLVKIRKKALLVPTPGQPEQELLAKEMSQKNYFVVQNQHQLNLKLGLQKLNDCRTFEYAPIELRDFLDQRLRELLRNT